MPKTILKGVFAICFGLGLFLLAGTTCQARVVYQNEETQYVVVIEDKADLLWDDEIDELCETMKEITAYGNVAFVSVEYNSSSTEDFAAKKYMKLFGMNSGTLFLIDMDNRYIYIHSDGAVYKIITEDYAETITDNVYDYAADEEYFDCANEAFLQIHTLLKGERIAQPMKYISNALLALFFALLINFLWVSRFSRLKQPKPEDISNNIQKQFHYSNPQAILTHESDVYSPVSYDSSGGGYSSSGSRSGRSSSSSRSRSSSSGSRSRSRSSGGRRRSGGGGGHRF